MSLQTFTDKSMIRVARTCIGEYNNIDVSLFFSNIIIKHFELFKLIRGQVEGGAYSERLNWQKEDSDCDEPQKKKCRAEETSHIQEPGNVAYGIQST
jgi:hypothetical protein